MTQSPSYRTLLLTLQAIEQAVNSGASLAATNRAGRVGSTMTWAAAQNNRAVFNTVENVVWGHKK